MVAASELAVLMNEELPKRFPDTDPLFEPPQSTFTPTKREANVPNVNTLPGKDVMYLDARVLPQYGLDEVEAAVRGLCDQVAAKYGVGFENRLRPARAGLGPDPHGKRHRTAPYHGREGRLRRRRPSPRAWAAGTVAAFLRRAGHEAAVWGTLMHNAHQPNERASIKMQVGDMKVMAKVLFA